MVNSDRGEIQMKIIIEKDEHAMSESAMQIILGNDARQEGKRFPYIRIIPKDNVSNDGSLCKRQATIQRCRLLPF